MVAVKLPGIMSESIMSENILSIRITKLMVLMNSTQVNLKFIGRIMLTVIPKD